MFRPSRRARSRERNARSDGMRNLVDADLVWRRLDNFN
jgi:hypothetical protein